MSDEQKRALLALLIGDIPNTPFYPIFKPAEYDLFLNNNSGSVDASVPEAAISAAMIVGGYNSREQIGDFVLVNDYATNYLKALKFLMSNKVRKLPANLMPWSASIGQCQIELLKTVPDCCPAALKACGGY